MNSKSVEKYSEIKVKSLSMSLLLTIFFQQGVLFMCCYSPWNLKFPLIRATFSKNFRVFFKEENTKGGESVRIFLNVR